MNKKLAGTLFVFNGNKYDYCYKEAIKSLLECCDKVFVLAGGDDNTFEDVYAMNENMDLTRLTQKMWYGQQGQEKLSYFQNFLIDLAHHSDYEYQFCLQADEIIHQKCYKEIHEAIKTGAEGYLIKRINLWKSPYLQLDVPHERMPCNTSIVRLAKTKYRSYSDGESLAVPVADSYFYEGINIWHYGFVRKKEIMKSKIVNMQEAVFLGTHDAKLDQCEVFNPDLWFNPDTELKLIDYPHPKIMKTWISTRP